MHVYYIYNIFKVSGEEKEKEKDNISQARRKEEQMRWGVGGGATLDASTYLF